MNLVRVYLFLILLSSMAYIQILTKKNRNFKDWQSLARSKFLEICKVNENLTATIKNEIKIKETNKFIHKKYILQFDQDRKAPIDILTPLKINPKAVIICLLLLGYFFKLSINFSI